MHVCRYRLRGGRAATCANYVHGGYEMLDSLVTQTSHSEALTTVGLVFMLTSVGAVLTLLVFCYRRVLKTHDQRDEDRTPP